VGGGGGEPPPDPVPRPRGPEWEGVFSLILFLLDPGWDGKKIRIRNTARLYVLFLVVLVLFVSIQHSRHLDVKQDILGGAHCCNP
jgi:hypothetical protein